MKNFFLTTLLLLAGIASYANQADTTRVLIVGNSFTFFFDSWDVLQTICESEGKAVDIVHVAQPGYTFGNHLMLEQTTKAIMEGGYDYAILQDQSQTPAWYSSGEPKAANAVENLRTLAYRIKGWSPDVQIINECTWAYTGRKNGGFKDVKTFDKYLQKGSKSYAKSIGSKVSPIGKAFQIVRKERPDINLYDPDNCHPSLLGIYLKCCVNYLTIFGGSFSDNVSNFGLDPAIAEYLRSIAQRVV